MTFSLCGFDTSIKLKLNNYVELNRRILSTNIPFAVIKLYSLTPKKKKNDIFSSTQYKLGIL